jgi:hypothetical protein
MIELANALVALVAALHPYFSGVGDVPPAQALSATIALILLTSA